MRVGAEVSIGPSFQFCINSPALSEFKNKYLSIRIGRFVLGIDAKANASASIVIGADANAMTSTNVCVGIH